MRYLSVNRGHLVVLELELPFVVALLEGRTVRVILFEVDVVALRVVRGVAAVLANVNLSPSFLVSVTVCHSVDFLRMGLERASLGKSLITSVALVRTDSCNKMKRIISIITSLHLP